MPVTDEKHGSFIKISGPSCSKLTTSLVNVSLKFLTISEIFHYFLLNNWALLLNNWALLFLNIFHNAYFKELADGFNFETVCLNC